MRWAIGLSVVVLAVPACMPRGPVLDTSERPPGVGGTISGTVRASEGTVGLAGRTVTAVDLATGDRHETSTGPTGGYTMKVPRGRYRLEVELRPGEVLSEQPSELQIDASDMDSGRDFVIAPKRGQAPFPAGWSGNGA